MNVLNLKNILHKIYLELLITDKVKRADLKVKWVRRHLQVTNDNIWGITNLSSGSSNITEDDFRKQEGNGYADI